jgi:hypothetical protein
MEELDISHPQLGEHKDSFEWQCQGDPLSPMLFVLVMEVINHVIRWLDHQSLLTPFANAKLPQRTSIYADDLILFVAPINGDLTALRTVLQVFGQASGLFANLDKSVATPIHCSHTDPGRASFHLQAAEE